jgi:hypothetical protein
MWKGRRSVFMNRIPVSSSNLKSVGYENQTLEIEFHSGGLYQYPNVPSSIYQGLMSASSKGSYFAQQIKNRFPFHRLR